MTIVIVKQQERYSPGGKWPPVMAYVASIVAQGFSLQDAILPTNESDRRSKLRIVHGTWQTRESQSTSYIYRGISERTKRGKWEEDGN